MIEILNWRKFQHYKDRRPPWIKIHDSLLDSTQWGRLDGESAKVLIELWLVAGREGDDGMLMHTEKTLAWLLRRSEQRIASSLKVLEMNKFVKVTSENDSASLASCCTPCKQVVPPETETETETKAETKAETDFCAFWTAYPRKVGKLVASKAWRNAKSKPSIEIILKAVRDQKCSEQWRKSNGDFIPHPSTWINQGRWDDVVGIEEEPRCKKCGWEVSKCTCEDNIPL